ncbi:hypothetical protein DVH24_036161 [Malus domestica]|uniref:Uncharacterized protein n=1 Tax=Malus domestica TaxID=3750 RepID=A0A498IF09_MALDO|nr:hypothetical protein DVH24_036161 [Malus domestica]
MTWLHTIPPLGSLKTCCPVIRAAPNQTPHPGSPKQNLDDIRSGGNDQITYRKLCSFNNFADGSWDLSRLPCLSSDLDEVPVLQRGYEEFNCSGGKGFDSFDSLANFSVTWDKKDEAYFKALLKTVQSTPGLYFSYKTDITLNFERRCKLVEGWMAKPIWKQLPDCTAKAKGLICHTYNCLKEVYPASRYNLIEMIDSCNHFCVCICMF